MNSDTKKTLKPVLIFKTKSRSWDQLFNSEFSVYIIFVTLTLVEDLMTGLLRREFKAFVGKPIEFLLHSVFGCMCILIGKLILKDKKMSSLKKSVTIQAVGIILILGIIIIDTECFISFINPSAPNRNISALQHLGATQMKIVLFYLATSGFTIEKRYTVFSCIVPLVYLLVRTSSLRVLNYAFIPVPIYLVMFVPWFKLCPRSQQIQTPKLLDEPKTNSETPELSKPQKTLSNLLLDQESLLNIIPEGLMILRHDGKPLLTNDALLKIFDCTDSNIVEKVFSLPNKEYLESRINPNLAVRRSRSVVETPSAMFSTCSSTPVLQNPSPDQKVILNTPPKSFKDRKKLNSDKKISKFLGLRKNTDSLSVLSSGSVLTDKQNQPASLVNIEEVSMNTDDNSSKKDKEEKLYRSHKISSPVRNIDLEDNMQTRIRGNSENTRVSWSKREPLASMNLQRRPKEVSFRPLNLETFRLPSRHKTISRFETPTVLKATTKLDSITNLQSDNTGLFKTIEDNARELKDTEKLADIQAENLQPRLNDLVEQLLSTNIRSKHETVGQAIKSVVNRLQATMENFSKDPSPMRYQKRFGKLSADRETVKRADSNNITESQLISNGLTCYSSFSIVFESFHRISASSVKYLEIKISPFILHGQTCLILLIRDITEKDITRRLKQQNLQKAAALASIVHDFRAPLNAINSSIECLNFKLDKNTKESLLRPANIAAKSLMMLVNDILDIHQIGKNKLKLALKDANIREVLEECIDLFRIKAEAKGIELKLLVDVNVPEKIRTDENRLQQILVNLLSNALKFTTKGAVKLEATVTYQRRIRLAVKDSGIGIQKDQIGKLFKTFGKIESETNAILNPQGIGLGLNISHKLASLLCTSARSGIKVESEYGYGTEFYFEIDDLSEEIAEIQLERREYPLSGHADKSSALKTITPEKSLNSSFLELHNGDYEANVNSIELLNEIKTINILSMTNRLSSPKIATTKNILCGCSRVLVVDDDEFNIMACKNLFRIMGVTQIDIAYNGQEAIDLIKEKYETSTCCRAYSFILMDCEMPVLDGVSASQQLANLIRQKELPQLTIIGTTGHTVSSVEEKCKKAGMIEVLTKPLKRTEVSELLARYPF